MKKLYIYLQANITLRLYAMKNKWFLLIIVFLILSAFTTSEILKINAPSITILDNGNIFKPGEIVYYTVNISSIDYLDLFEVEADVLSADNKKNSSFTFEDKTKKATINYFYVIPSNIQTSTINIKFTIKDKENLRVVEKQIKIKK